MHIYMDKYLYIYIYISIIYYIFLKSHRSPCISPTCAAATTHKNHIYDLD